MQHDIDKLTVWLKKLRIQVNKSKSTAIMFSKKRKEHPPFPKLNEHEPLQSDEVKYLGIHLDGKLTFKRQTTEYKTKARQLLVRLYLTINRNSKLSLENKLKIIKTIYIPTITYGVEIWSIANESTIQHLQAQINKTVKIAACTMVHKQPTTKRKTKDAHN